MKRITVLFALICLFVGAFAQQQPLTNVNAATYYALDTTTFFVQVNKAATHVWVDYTTLNADDAVLFLGIASVNDVLGHGDFNWSGGSTPDSLVLNVTANTRTQKLSTGVRSSTARHYWRFDDGIKTNMLAVTIKWNSVTSGRIKIYAE